MASSCQKISTARLWLTRRINRAGCQIAFPDASFRKPGQLFIAGENVFPDYILRAPSSDNILTGNNHI